MSLCCRAAGISTVLIGMDLCHTGDDHAVIVPEFRAEFTSPLVAESLQHGLERIGGNQIVQYLVAQHVLVISFGELDRRVISNH